MGSEMDRKGRAAKAPGILVADDDKSLMRLVTKVLSRQGYEVEGVTTGHEVITHVTEGQSQLLLLDYNLPDMNGRQIVENLSSRGFDPPFIVMTGHGDEKLAVEMMKLGARDYVMKDVAFVDLLPSVVRQAMDQLHVEGRLKVTEAGLKQSEEKFAKAFMASPDWILILTLDDGTIVEANDTFHESSGFRRGEAIGTSCRDLGLCVDPSRWKGMFETIQVSEECRNWEMDVKVKSGEKRTLLMSAEPLEFGGKQCAICVAHDITERKQDQERIMASLREKDHLLKEIHHRVKNNLQVIASLLNLQGRDVQEEAVRDIFGEVGNRIKSMALVHEMLYSAEDFSGVDFEAYVRALLDNLYRSMGVSPKRIMSELHMEGTSLGIDYAVPCGLIVNELASNSLKYAFPGDARGKIQVTMEQSDEDEGTVIRIVFEDDGAGLPEGMDFQTAETLGMKLVKLLCQRQLGGSVSCSNRSAGTRFDIEFCIKGQGG
jgi:PAS domain S-box-containing protein